MSEFSGETSSGDAIVEKGDMGVDLGDMGDQVNSALEGVRDFLNTEIDAPPAINGFIEGTADIIRQPGAETVGHMLEGMGVPGGDAAGMAIDAGGKLLDWADQGRKP